ncbi:hypothetical protein [Nitriliruptor alkaliphilus]|uniref:hypothetical protein n=1 Tax=Nitriliruptor alkaliphilus TaxID=427918 RepID=UPI0006960899|nr:hypothetical protein [Nitriliruptor alkaliphilus]
MSTGTGVRGGGAPLRRLGHALLIDVAARLLFAIGLVGMMVNLLAGDVPRLPPGAVLVAGLCGMALMLVTESRVFRLREQFELRVHGRRLWSVTSGEERAALHRSGQRRLELMHRVGTLASWMLVVTGLILGSVVLVNP